jgi:hypothetical protein
LLVVLAAGADALAPSAFWARASVEVVKSAHRAAVAVSVVLMVSSLPESCFSLWVTQP